MHQDEKRNGEEIFEEEEEEEEEEDEDEDEDEDEEEEEDNDTGDDGSDESKEPESCEDEDNTEMTSTHTFRGSYACTRPACWKLKLQLISGGEHATNAVLAVLGMADPVIIAMAEKALRASSSDASSSPSVKVERRSMMAWTLGLCLLFLSFFSFFSFLSGTCEASDRAAPADLRTSWRGVPFSATPSV